MKAKIQDLLLNGAKVVTYSMSGVGAVHLMVVINAGAWYEKTPWGAHHYLEHLLFDATEKFPNEFAVELYKEKYAIKNNSTTAGGDIEMWFKFSEENIDQGLELFEQMFFKPLFLEKDMEREINIIRQEYVDKWSDPRARFWRATQEKIYGKGHPYAKDALGDPEYLKTVDRKKLQAIHKKFFVTSNMSIGVVGKVDSASIKRKLKTILNGYDKKAKPSIKLPKKKMLSGYCWHKEDQDQLLLSYTWIIPGRDSLDIKQRVVLGLARYIMGGSMRSRLHRSLRLESGLVYKNGFAIHHHPSSSELEIWAATSKKNSQVVVDKIFVEIDKITKDGLSDKEFKRAVSYMNAQTLLAYDSVERICDIITYSIYNYGRYIRPDEYMEVANKIKPSDVVEVISKYLADNKPYVSVMAREDPKLTL